MGQFICFDAKFIYVHLKERNRDYSVYKYMLYLFYLFSQRKEEKKIKFVKSLILKLRYKMNYGSDCKRSLGFCKKQNSKRLTMLSTFPLKVFSFFYFLPGAFTPSIVKEILRGKKNTLKRQKETQTTGTTWAYVYSAFLYAWHHAVQNALCCVSVHHPAYTIPVVKQDDDSVRFLF